MRIVAEFDTKQAEANAKKLNQTVEQVGTAAKAAGDQAAASFDKMTEAAKRSQSVYVTLGEDLVGTARDAEAATARQTTRTKELTEAMKEQARVTQEQKRAGGSGPKPPKDADALNAEWYRQQNEARIKDEKDKHSKIDAMIAASQAKELTGLQRVEAERRKALASYVSTEEHAKKINAHFDQMASKAGNQEFANKIKNFVQNPMQAAGDAAGKLAMALGPLGITAAAAGFVLFEAFKFLKSQADELARYSLEMQNLAARTGLSTEEVQEFSFAAKYAGVDAGVLSMAVKKLNEDMADGGTESAKITSELRYLNIQLQHNADGTLNAGNLIDQAFRSLQKIPDYYNRAAAAQTLFGKGAKELLPLIDNYAEFTKRAREFQDIKTDSEMQAAREYTRTLEDLAGWWDKVKNILEQPIIVSVAFAKRVEKLNDHFINPDVYYNGGDAGDAQASAAQALARLQNGQYGSDQEGRFKENARRGNSRLDNVLGPDQRLKSLKADLAGYEEDLKRATDAAKSGGASSTAQEASAKEAKRVQDQIDQTKKLIEQQTYLAGATKATAAAIRTARHEADAAEAKSAGGQRALELQNANAYRQASTTVGAEGTEFTNKSPALKAEFDRQLRANRRFEERKEQAESRVEQNKSLDEQAQHQIAAARLRNQTELDGIKLREVQGGESLRVLEDARLESTRRMLAEVEQLEKASILRRRDAELVLLGTALSNNLSANPEERAAQVARASARVGQISGAAADAVAALHANTVQAGAGNSEHDAQVARDRAQRLETRELVFENQTIITEHEQVAVKQREAAELDSLQLVQAHTLSERLALSQRRLAIEVSYLREEEALRKEAVTRQIGHEIDLYNERVTKEGIGDNEAEAQRQAIYQKGIDQRWALDQDLQAQIQAAQRQTAIQGAQEILDANRRIYDQIKQETETMLDILFSNSKHKGEDIAEEFKKIGIKMAKEIIATQISILATGAAIGQPVGQQTNTAGTGIGGILSRVLGVQPKFQTPPFIPGKANGIESAAAANRTEAGRAQAAALGTLKIQQPGSIGDVHLISGAVPVYVINAGGGSGGSQNSSSPIDLSGLFQGNGSPTPRDNNGDVGRTGSAGTSFATRAAGWIGTLLGIGGLGGMFGGAATARAAEGGGGALAAAGNRLPGENGSLLPSFINRTGSTIDGVASASDPLTTGTLQFPFGGGGAAQTASSGAAKAAASPGGLKGLFSGQLASLKNFIGFGGGKNQYGSQLGGTGEGIKGGLTALGKSGAAELGGTLLATDGLRRGGIGGALETTAGGAMIGFKYGGPMGAAIGAAVGAAAGTVRYFWHTKAEEAKARIKERYGLNVNSSVAGQVADAAKQKYGGSIDAALQGGEVQQMLSLYAQQTGGNYGLVGPQQATLAYSGGGLQQAGTYTNGKLLGFNSSLSSVQGFDGTIGSPTFDKFGQDASKITLSLDGPSSAQFLQGQTVNAISNNPGAVSDANLAANRTSTNRQAQYASMASPSTVLA